MANVQIHFVNINNSLKVTLVDSKVLILPSEMIMNNMVYENICRGPGAETHMKYITHTLVIVKTQTDILLGYKKRGNGKGKWNSFGGKVEKGESMEAAAVRELKEECGLDCKDGDLIKVGRMDFSYQNKNLMSFVHVFKTETFSGEVIESEEMRPEWYPLEEIPYDQMWNSDRIWLPLLLEGNRFRGWFQYDSEGIIAQSSLKILDIGEQLN